jgi:hypothetical protein
MAKKELEDKIRSLVKQTLTDKFVKKTDDVLQTQDVEIEVETFPLLTQFPTLKEVIVKLLTKQYKSFIKDIWWVAPRPTTFKVILENDQYFYLIYGQRSWVAKVSGKKYYLNNINEEQNAAKSIADLLMYGPAAAKEEISGEVPAGGETPPDETSFSAPTEEIPPIEEPAATEEVPEEVPA